MNNRIQERQAILYQARDQLKTDFFGLDEIIDRVIDSIETWYVLPEVIFYPVIVNLWGLTGVGKTDLVRKLVKYLGFQDRFVEIVMDGMTNGHYAKSIRATLQASFIEEGEPGIILFDEIQRYRTITDDREEIRVDYYQDIWMLLSDGKFSCDYTLFKGIESEFMEQSSLPDDDEDQDNPPPKKPVKKVSGYQASIFRNMLKLKESIPTIMSWTQEQLYAKVQEFIAARKNDELDYSKTLVFVSGNLDEAFVVANSVDDCDTDADVFFEMSKRVSVIKIKEALAKRFRPEQVGRFGNNHIIYPSLNKENYEKLIRRTCKAYAELVCKQLSITINIDHSVYDEIYTNSVYPAQGTRPVLSSIHTIFGSSLTRFALAAAIAKSKEMTISINGKASLSIATFDDGTVVTCPAYLDINARKRLNTRDFNTLVAVHEAGHALVHAVLFGVAPMEVKINIASFKGGYNVVNTDDDVDHVITKQQLLDKITVCMAGAVAEQMVFGFENQSSGHSSDLRYATMYAGQYHRRLAFGTRASATTVSHGQKSDLLNTDIQSTNIAVDVTVSEQKARAEKIIGHYKSALVAIVNQLLAKNVLGAEEFVAIVKPYLDVMLLQTADTNVPYLKLWDSFKR
jgi:cell division protease FtsH